MQPCAPLKYQCCQSKSCHFEQLKSFRVSESPWKKPYMLGKEMERTTEVTKDQSEDGAFGFDGSLGSLSLLKTLSDCSKAGSQDLRHPNIVTCLGFECKKDSFYIYLEYVPGRNMFQLQHTKTRPDFFRVSRKSSSACLKAYFDRIVLDSRLGAFASALQRCHSV